jgi:hypothetical protein
VPSHRELGLRITDPCPRDVPELPSIANDGRQQQPANMKLGRALNPRATHENTLVMRSSLGGAELPTVVRDSSSPRRFRSSLTGRSLRMGRLAAGSLMMLAVFLVVTRSRPRDSSREDGGEGCRNRRSISCFVNRFVNRTQRDSTGWEREPTERDVICRVRRGHHARERLAETAETHVVWLITQRQQVHNRDMTQERRHADGHGLATAVHWVRSHLPRWRRRPPTVGVREPRRPKPTLPAAAVALKEPRAGLMHRIKLGNRHTGEQT